MKLPFIDKLIQIFIKLSKREKIVLYAAVFVLVTMFSDRTIVQPILGRFHSLQQQYSDLQTDVKKSVRLLTQKDRMTQEMKQYEGYMIEPKSPDKETSELLRQVERVADESTINLLYAKPGGNKSEDQVKKFYVTLECEGKMDQIVKFFYSLESAKQLLRVEKFILQPTGKASSVIKCAASVSKTIISL